MDRKYKQRGYSDRESEDKKEKEANAQTETRVPRVSRAQNRK